jgi:hypothetical protein
MLTWHQANSYPFLAKAMLNKLLKILLNQVNTRPNPTTARVGTLAGLLLHALERWLAYYSPRLPNKAQKQESCRRDKKLWVS